MTSSLRIGLVAPPWLPVPPPGYGGTENVIDTLARGLVAAGHDVILCATADSTCPVPLRSFHETGQLERIHHSGAELTHVLHAYEALADRDVIHDHTVVGPVLAASAGDRRALATCHGAFDRETRIIYGKASRVVPIVAISHHHASTAEGVRVAGVIHHGVEPDRFPIGRGDGGYLVFLGRMSPTKGVDVAARVARQAGVPLRIAAKMAEADELDYFDRAVRPLLGGDVEYVGEIGGSEKLELLGGARALLNPLRWHEPFGMVMIESLACGTPVIATPRGSAPEIVDHGRTGFVADGVDDLVAAVQAVGGLDRAACRKVVETRFSADRMVAEHVALYRQIAGDRAVPGALDHLIVKVPKPITIPPQGPGRGVATAAS